MKGKGEMVTGLGFGDMNVAICKGVPRVGRLLSLGTLLPPPPPSGPPGPLSYQGSMATGYTYGGAEGARKFFSFPLPT